MQQHANRRRTSRSVGVIPMCAFLIALAAALMPFASARAASVSFFLDQSSRLPDGVDYLSVTLTENGDGVNVRVTILDSLNGLAGDRFGIQAFGFGLRDGVADGITDLPDGWRVRHDKRMDGFGRFDFRFKGRGWARTDELSFTVAGVGLDDFDSLFAAHVAGFEWCATEEEACAECRGRDRVTSAYFGGGEPAPIPVPPAAWLFGTGLLGLIGVARRSRT